MIIPTLVANSQKELEKRISKVKKYYQTFQLDVVDGKFANNLSFQFDFKLPKGFKYEAHLMVNRPEDWIENHGHKVNKIIFHIEPVNNIPQIIKLIRSKKKKVGLALKPHTPITRIKKYLGQVDQVTILTVNPGFYGSKFLVSPLKKIKQIKLWNSKNSKGLGKSKTSQRKLNKKVIVQIDGGMNPKTIALAKKRGADAFCVGSFLQKSKDLKKSFQQLKQAEQ